MVGRALFAVDKAMLAVRPHPMAFTDGSRLCFGGFGNEYQIDAYLISDLKLELLTRLFTALPELFQVATCVSEAYQFLEQTTKRRLKGYKPSGHHTLITYLDRDWEDDPLPEGAPPLYP